MNTILADETQLHSTASRAQLTHNLDRAVHFFLTQTIHTHYETLGPVHFTSAYFGNLCAHSSHKSIISTNTILRFIFAEISVWVCLLSNLSAII